ncbi:hypothetical protein NQ314_021044 [Rhamnusium bicolor]|uniref:Uncharacterized protein n=1 Tax=Rhamnusium bicolor TaxID=1586634 RepID=A0AAV8WJC9_9CUCU|nr:hypothetical protein NQ314_021044 [Rhamnusium bicolor]
MYVCKKFRCFKNISPDIRQTLFQHFYHMTQKNEEDSNLVAIMSMKTIGRRRLRNNIDENRRKTKPATSHYKVRHNGGEYPVCRNGF